MDKEESSINIPYVVYESAMTRAERNAKRLTIALIISIALMFASNILWLHAWCQYDYVGGDTSTVYQQDGEGLNIMGDGNEANNGAKDNSNAASPGENPKETGDEGDTSKKAD